MKVIAITGGVGMGKSAAGALLESRDVPVIDTDDLARRETEIGSPGLAEIAAHFGADVILSDGQLDRSRLARLVFSDSKARGELEAILHPRIARAWREQLRLWKGAGETKVGVIIPLLFEGGFDVEFPAVVAIACSGSTQTKRLQVRGWGEREISVRNQAQLPVADKMARARFVIWTEGSLDAHGRQWDRILTVV